MKLEVNHTILQGSDSWKELRRSKITATDIGTITGVNPFTSPYQLWQRKLGLIEEIQENSAMKEGSKLEEVALTEFNEITKSDYKPVVLVQDWKMASLDGMCSRGSILEIKCGKASYEDAKNGIIAPYYYSQIQWQLYLSGENECWYICYRPDEKMIYWKIDRDNDYIEKLVEKGFQFYNCLISKTPPEFTDRDYETRNDKEWRMYAEIYRETKFKLKELEQKEDDLRKKLIELADGKASKGYGVSLRKIIKKGNIEYANIEVLKNMDLSIYRKKDVEYWSVRDE